MDKSQQDRLSIGKASEYLGVAVETLRRWDKSGKIESYRSPGGHRHFLIKDLEKLFKKRHSQETRKMAVVVKKRYPEGLEKSKEAKPGRPPYKKHRKSVNKRVPVRKILLFLLVFFASVDVILILFYFFAKNLTFSIPHF